MRTLVPALFTLCSVAAYAADAAPDIPVTAVTLYSSGVGYFEHSGTVDGVATAELRFKTGQINDVLKSLILQDLDGGTIGTVVFPSQDPLEKTLGSFQVDLRGSPTLGQLLGQLRGAPVVVTWQTEHLSGTILGVESRTVTVGDKQTIVVAVLSILTETGIRQVALNEVSGVALADPKLNQELTRALAAVAGARDQDTKPVDLRFDGQGKRHVRLGYVVETPLWKVSYRLVMPDIKADPAKSQGALQGWALLENQTDSDWNNVRLALVSGRPISFIQDLYKPRYLPRPTVEPQEFASLAPQTYQKGAALLAPAAAPAPVMAMAGRMQAKENKIGRADKVMAEMEMDSASVQPMDPTSSVKSIAQAQDIGALFQYTVNGVTLPRQRSAMLPIITDPLAVERVSIYNENVLAKHPLNGALITNSTGKDLLQGPITVFDGGAYAGDARIDSLPPGGKRLLSFAIDIPLTVDPQSVQRTDQIVAAKLVDGVLWLSQSRLATQEYRLTSESDTPRVVVLEHEKLPDWSLKDTPAAYETTPELYRFKVQVPAGKTVSFTVRQTHVDQESMALLELSDQVFVGYLNNGAIPPKVKTALQQAAQLKAQVTEAERQRGVKQQELQQIVQDQNRLRENLKTVAANSQYSQRLLTKLNDQETKVEALQVDSEKLQGEADTRRKALAEFVRTLTVE